MAPALSARRRHAATSWWPPRARRPCSGDTAVAVHPEDERYQHSSGGTLRLPLAERDIPIIADAYVDPAFGSGCVKITPAHDFNDYEIGAAPRAAAASTFSRRARRSPTRCRSASAASTASRRASACSRSSTRAGLIEKHREAPARRAARRPQRRGARALAHRPVVREASPRWPRPAIAAVEQGRTRFVPENWSRTYFEWMRNIKDWCISRQLWWGHRIPAWYDAAGRSLRGPQRGGGARARTSSAARASLLRQDEDVLDTWFSSALWPFSTLGWPRAHAASWRASIRAACWSPASTSSSSGSPA